MPKKQKQTLPEIDDKVCLRGRNVTGILKWYSKDDIKNRWAFVQWDDIPFGCFDKNHPKYVGYVELEKMK